MKSPLQILFCKLYKLRSSHLLSQHLFLRPGILLVTCHFTLYLLVRRPQMNAIFKVGTHNWIVRSQNYFLRHEIECPTYESQNFVRLFLMSLRKAYLALGYRRRFCLFPHYRYAPQHRSYHSFSFLFYCRYSKLCTNRYIVICHV